MCRFVCTPRHFASLLVACVEVVAVACGGSNPAAPKVDPSVLPSMDLMLADKTLGSATAPNTVIEYSSFECPYCKDFHDTWFPKLKSDYIDPGKVRFIYRDSPLNTGFDLTASMLARCAGDRFFEAVDALYATQTSWKAVSGNETAALGNVMRNFGMSQAVIDACEASTTLKNGILQIQQDGRQRWQVQGVPTFIVNDTNVVVGNLGLAALTIYFQ